MDTSILGTMFEIAPDLMQEMELRALILERVAALGPIGRRALAARMHLAEREVRSAADALRRAGCITQSAAGMELTEHGRALAEAARMVSRGRRSLSSVELALSRRLNAERVCVVHGDADADPSVYQEAARAAAQQIRFLLQGAQILAVSGGEELALTAEAVSLAAPIDVTVVPAQGGMNGSIRTQANTLAEAFAGRLGGQSRMLHLPEGISAQAAEELSRLPQVREVLELLRHADVLLYSVERADWCRERLMQQDGAQAYALGFCFGGQGEVIGSRASLTLRAQDIGQRCKAAAIAVGSSRAEAIMAVCAHHPHRLLVTDEGAARRILELLRVS